jgi:hypothetical protein
MHVVEVGHFSVVVVDELVEGGEVGRVKGGAEHKVEQLGAETPALKELVVPVD